MSFYPTITGNTEAKFNLASNTDSNFDVYVFEETNGIQSAYMVFILKNTSSSSGQDLDINSMSGNADFNAHFTLSPVEGSLTLIHLGQDGSTNNKIKVKADIAQAISGVTTTECDAHASGANGFIGVKLASDITDAEGELNFSTNTHASELNSSATSVIPIYNHSSIIANTIPHNSYCAFVVKYKPTASFTATDVSPKLTINNSDTTRVIEFNGTSVNILTFQARLGTGTANADEFGADTFTASATVFTDGQTLDLGLHPRDYDWGTTNKVVEFADFSATPGDYNFNGGAAGFFANNNFSQISAIDQNYDGVTYTPEGNIHARSRFSESIYTAKSYLSYSTHLANEIDSSPVSVTPPATNLSGVGVYKNFSLRAQALSGNLVNYRSTHYNPEAAGADLYDDYKHVTEGDITLKVWLKLGKILNASYPAQTADGTNNQMFVLGITCGFYNKLSFNDAQRTLHKNATEAIFINRFFNGSVEGSGGDNYKSVPHFFSNSNIFYRGSECNLGVNVRYNNFDSQAATDYLIGDVDFDATGTGSMALHSNYGGDQANASGNAFATHYNTAEFNDVTGSNITQSTLNQTHAAFNNSTGGTFLGLKYPLHVNGFLKDHLYDSGDYENIGYREKNFGVIDFTYRPAYSGDDNIWTRGLGSVNVPTTDDSHGVKYKGAFLPKPSEIALVTSEELFTETSTDKRIFKQSGNDDQTLYPSNVVKQPIAGSWYPYNSASNQSSNITSQDYTELTQSSVNTEDGLWYGAGGLAIFRPYAWSQLSSSRVFETTSSDPTPNGNGYYIKHKNTKNTITKNTAGDPENDFDGINVNYTLRLEDASYSSDLTKYRTVGRLYFENTGDYPAHIHSVAIGSKEPVYLDGTNSKTGYNLSGNMLLPAASIKNKPVDTGTASSSSNDPDWKVSFHKSSQWGDSYASSGKQMMIPALHANSTGSVTIDSAHYTAQNNNPSSVHLSKKKFISTDWDDQVDRDNVNNNFVEVLFDLSPTNDSTKDQGKYFAQIFVTYYVGDYENRHTANVNTTTGLVNEGNSLIGDNNNIQTRLKTSCYLVEVNVAGIGELELTDAEGDESGNTIELPNISIG